MRYLPHRIRNTLLTAVAALACLALVSCGASCVAGFFSSGNNSIFIKTSTPPPACPLSTGMSMMNVAVIKAPLCDTCPVSSRAEHIFVTIKTIQLHSVYPDSPSSPEWLELVPQVVRASRQIDLVGDPAPETLVQSARIPAGTYRELRVQFLPDAPADSDVLLTDNSCGRNRNNCMLMADGRIEKLYFTGDDNASELLLLQYNGSSPLVVVPGQTVDLQLTLQPQHVSSISPEGWQTRYVLVGRVSVSR